MHRSLDTNAFSLPMLQYLNMPIKDSALSPAKVLFARKLRDGMQTKLESLQMRPEWVLFRDEQVAALKKRHLTDSEKWFHGTKQLRDLVFGNSVLIKNQTGNKKGKWSLSGTVREVLGNHSYMVKLDGSGRLSKRRDGENS